MADEHRGALKLMATKRMLIDASHSEETRVLVVNGNRLEDFDVEVESRKRLKGNVYLAKVIRVEPSLQAAFIDYGGNRHGFLAFGEIHPDYYQIPVADREALLVEEAAQQLADAEEDNIDAVYCGGDVRGNQIEFCGSCGTSRTTGAIFFYCPRLYSQHNHPLES